MRLLVNLKTKHCKRRRSQCATWLKNEQDLQSHNANGETIRERSQQGQEDEAGEAGACAGEPTPQPSQQGQCPELIHQETEV